MAADVAHERTLGDVGRLGACLRVAIEGADSLWAAKSGGPDFEAGSNAATEAAVISSERVGALLEEVHLRYLPVFDNAVALVRLGEAASRAEESPAYVQYGIARSVLETLSEVWWLLDEAITAEERAGRYLSLLRYELRSQQALRLGSFKEELEALDADAARLNLAKVGEDFRVGYGAPLPSHSALVSKLDGSRDPYALLSAAAHGESWAVLNLGYRIDESHASGLTHLTKSPPAIGYCFAISEAYSALCRCVIREAAYRGWDAIPFIRATQKADAEAGL